MKNRLFFPFKKLMDQTIGKEIKEDGQNKKILGLFYLFNTIKIYLHQGINESKSYFI